MITLHRRMGLWLALALAWAPAVSARETGYQLRLVGHFQFVQPGERIGLAAWAILPDVMNQTSLRALLFTGGVFRGDRTWTEIMAGALLSRTEKTTFELDVRYLERRVRWMTVFAEAEYNFGSRKWFIQPSATVPARIGRVRFGVGAESDFVFAPNSRLTVVGPRLSIPLPVCRRVCKDSSVITAYRIQSDGRRFVRNYLLLVF